MNTCMSCGGAIFEPGKPYAYAGKVCHCTLPSPQWRKATQAEEDALKRRLAEEASKTITGITGITGITVSPTPAPGSMTATEFVHWLRGYAAGAGALPLPIHEALQKVRT